MARTFRNGDRVRVTTTGDDGFPIVRYGIVGADFPSTGPVVVLFDDLDGGDIVNGNEIELVTMSAIELRLQGADLLLNPALRAGLADLWRAEANLAGITIAALFPLEAQDAEQYLLAEFNYAGEPWVVRGAIDSDSSTTVVLRADRMNRWDGFIQP